MSIAAADTFFGIFGMTRVSPTDEEIEARIRREALSAKLEHAGFEPVSEERRIENLRDTLEQIVGSVSLEVDSDN